MVDRQDMELFGVFATSYVLRGRRSWTFCDLMTRLEGLGFPTDCRRSLANLCAVGWIFESSPDVFDLTDEGGRSARNWVSPFLAGDG